MKTFKIVLFCLLLTTVGASAQYGNNMYNKNYGVNRNIGRNYSPPPSATPAEIEKNKQEQLDKLMQNLKEELKLDELQNIAIRNEIEKNSKNIDIVIKKEVSDEDKSKEINSMMERTDKLINSYLNPAQKDKYKAFVEDARSNDKKKKNKNKKEDKKPVDSEEIKNSEE